MGTRADFYVGRDKAAEWIGSVAYNGASGHTIGQIVKRKTEKGFRSAVARLLARRDDATVPAQGWPWPWNNSATTDCSYWFFDDAVWREHDGWYYNWATFHRLPDKIKFPDMSARKKLALDQRSGVLFVYQPR